MASSSSNLEASVPTTETKNLLKPQPLSSNTEQLRTAMASGSSVVAGSYNGAPDKAFLRQQGSSKQHEGQIKPLQLLDLPIDILQEILKEVSNE